MKIFPLEIPELLMVQPRVLEDKRGFFFESFNENEFAKQAGIRPRFVQDNVSRSAKHVLRGLHYQISHAQDKLVRVTAGEIYDVAVDVRRRSATFGKHVACRLNSQTRHALWIPAGFAHGFLILSEFAEILYKVTDYWYPQHERRIIWNDAELNIPWPIIDNPILAPADAAAPRLRDTDVFP